MVLSDFCYPLRAPLCGWISRSRGNDTTLSRRLQRKRVRQIVDVQQSEQVRALRSPMPTSLTRQRRQSQYMSASSDCDPMVRSLSFRSIATRPHWEAHQIAKLRSMLRPGRSVTPMKPRPASQKQRVRLFRELFAIYLGSRPIGVSSLPDRTTAITECERKVLSSIGGFSSTSVDRIVIASIKLGFRLERCLRLHKVRSRFNYCGSNCFKTRDVGGFYRGLFKSWSGSMPRIVVFGVAGGYSGGWPGIMPVIYNLALPSSNTENDTPRVSDFHM